MKLFYQRFVDETIGATYLERLTANLKKVARTGEQTTEIDVHPLSPPDSYAHPAMEFRCARWFYGWT